MSTALLTAALSMRAAGNSVVPATDKKYPEGLNWDGYKKAIPQPSDIERWFSNDRYSHLGVVCGKVSGNREMVDFDNKPAAIAAGLGAEQVHAWWCEIVDRRAPGLRERLTFENTPSGGFHYHYRAPDIEGNTKLAQWSPNPESPNDQRQVISLIETRGEGGQSLVTPSPGYRMIRGDLAMDLDL